jgi:putative ABC transport system permease protein
MSLYLTLAGRYLAGRKLRTVLTTLAIVFGVLLIFGMNTIMPAFIGAFQANALALAGQVDATITSKSGEAFPEAVAGTVAAVEGVRVVSGSLERAIGLPADFFDGDPAAPDRLTAVTLVGAVPQAIRSTASFNILQGRFLEAGDGAVAVITESLADEAGLRLGDTLSLPTPTGVVDLTIVGLLPQRLLPGNEEVLVTLGEAQRLFDAPGKINVIDANFDTADETRRAQIEADIAAALGGSFTIGVLQPGAEILTNIGTAQRIFTLIGALGLLMGGFIIFNTFRTVVAERRHDIGMLRAIGASRRTITWLILVEGLIQGVVGTVAGLLLGYGLGWLALAAASQIGRQLLNIQVGAPVVTPGLVVLSVAVGVGVTLLAGLLPARAASRVTPLEALRPAVGALSWRRMAGLSFWVGVVMLAAAALALVSGNAGLLALGSFLFIGGLTLVAPALINPIAGLFSRVMALVFARAGTAQLAEGNLSRQPTRAAVTSATTMIALAMLVMAAGLITSLAITFTDMLENSLASDYLLVPPSVTVWGVNTGASPALAEALRAVDGVDVVSSLRFAGTQINAVAVGLLGIEPRAYTQTSGLAFSEGDPEAAFRELEAGRGLIINGVLKASAGVSMGDEVTLLTPTGTVTYQVVGVASDYLNAKTTTGYLSQANIAADFGRAEDVFFQINLKPGADRAAVEAAFKDALQPYPQFKLVSGQDYVDQNRGIFDAAFAGIYALVIFLAVPSLIAMINTLAIGVIERTREIGMLRAVGAARSQVRTVILAEALILAAIGTSLGLLSGLYLGYMATSAFEALGFPVSYAFPAQAIVVAIAVGLLFGALAAILPARQAARLEIVQALRYE